MGFYDKSRIVSDLENLTNGANNLQLTVSIRLLFSLSTVILVFLERPRAISQK